MHEKRASVRHSFGVEQMVAGLVDGQMPPPEAFERVRCIDISQDGVAFFQGHRPDYQDLIIGLGIAPNIVYLLARIAHVEMIELCGSLVFRVGCQFTGRAEWSEQPANVLCKEDVDGAFQFLSNHASP